VISDSSVSDFSKIVVEAYQNTVVVNWMRARIANSRAGSCGELAIFALYGNVRSRGRIPWESTVWPCRRVLIHLLKAILSYHCSQPNESREKSLRFLHDLACFSRLLRARRAGSGHDLT